MPSRPSLSPAAQSLLRTLQSGTNVGEPRVYPGAFAFSTHAKAFLNNARSMCENDGMSDFRIYGALYLLRHGMELMLKCIARNAMIDAVLNEIAKPSVRLPELLTVLKITKRERRAKDALVRALCALRNYFEEGLVYPESHARNMEESDADRSIEYLRNHPQIPRDRFATVWTGSLWGHDLPELWTESKKTIAAFQQSAARHAVEIGFEPPMSVERLAVLCELLGALDDGGDGFRYPSSLTGEWYLYAPWISMEALIPVIESLENTCTVFESFREQAYEGTRVGSPDPHY